MRLSRNALHPESHLGRIPSPEFPAWSHPSSGSGSAKLPSAPGVGAEARRPFSLQTSLLPQKLSQNTLRRGPPSHPGNVRAILRQSSYFRVSPKNTVRLPWTRQIKYRPAGTGTPSAFRPSHQRSVFPATLPRSRTQRPRMSKTATCPGSRMFERAPVCTLTYTPLTKGLGYARSKACVSGRLPSDPDVVSASVRTTVRRRRSTPSHTHQLQQSVS